MSNAGAAGGAADATVATETALDPDRVLAKARGAVDYHHREAVALEVGVANAEAKAERFAQMADDARLAAAQLGAQHDAVMAELADAEAYLASLIEGGN